MGAVDPCSCPCCWWTRAGTACPTRGSDTLADANPGAALDGRGLILPRLRPTRVSAPAGQSPSSQSPCCICWDATALPLNLLASKCACAPVLMPILPGVVVVTLVPAVAVAVPAVSTMGAALFPARALCSLLRGLALHSLAHRLDGLGPCERHQGIFRITIVNTYSTIKSPKLVQ